MDFSDISLYIKKINLYFIETKYIEGIKIRF